MRRLREAWGTRWGIPMNTWMLKTLAFFSGMNSEVLLKSQRVLPKRLLSDGFRFEFTDWLGTAADLVRRWHENQDR
jgi:NAD dependent epimerase/dehydratase family enzyme